MRSNTRSYRPEKVGRAQRVRSIGHAALDAGGGSTYFNPQAGHELSAVAGFTYNLKNRDTQYQNGIDFHVDWGASQFLSKQIFVGLVG
jgi:hypothetical protein